MQMNDGGAASRGEEAVHGQRSKLDLPVKHLDRPQAMPMHRSREYDASVKWLKPDPVYAMKNGVNPRAEFAPRLNDVLLLFTGERCFG